MRREETLHQLEHRQPFDLLVIGGGATGCGIAVDAAARGLRVALVEKLDYGEGTSSRSTKLVHGGVRYLEMAVRGLDRAQYQLVRDGLFERGVLLRNAPHLAHRLPLVTPLYDWLEVPYVFAGLKLYDLLAGKKSLGSSRLIGRTEALRRFPLLKAQGLKAGVLYYDGQFNDARMALALILTASELGAVSANHVEALSLLKEQGRVRGARVRDRIGGREFDIRARGVINATGPFTDSIRRMDEADARPLLKASSGIHIVLNQRFAPPSAGLMIPKTEDGRVLFILPWQGHALIGTTDEPAEIVDHPRPRQEEIAYLLRHVRRYFNLAITPEDITSTWSGLRPLLDDPRAADTAHLTRDYSIQISSTGLLTIVGGKWTTYRKMAQDAVDQAVDAFALSPSRPCVTADLAVHGAQDFEPHGERRLVRDFGLDADVAAHLRETYGGCAAQVAELAREGLGDRLHSAHPRIAAEIVYAVRHEQAQRLADVLVRRTTLALLDVKAAAAAVPRTAEIMARELDWDESRRHQEIQAFEELLATAL
ncbi:FAD-dependent oxidoreductase [Geoalkalibacter sp.]|uniref:FAD-dependent oxidoreductase n=1 Tax=Geoalkalibacter sp. TaxID=3041440 RepID=UPI00272DE2BB|nr:FAD-dependent oxidoreductase [Geoalkalibacter sp.]